MRHTPYIFLLSMGLLFSGCSTTKLTPIRKDVEANDVKGMKDLARLQRGEGREVEPGRQIERVDGVWLPVRKVERSDRKEKLNEALLVNITLNRSFGSIQEIAERVTLLAGVPVNVDPDVIALLTNASLARAGQAGMSAPVAGMPAAGLPALPPPPGQPTNYQAQPNAFAVTYTGNLAGLLDVVAARYSVSWEWSNGAVRIYRLQSKTFRLVALPGDTTLNAKIVSGSGGGAGAGGGGGGSSTASGVTSSVGSSGTSTHETGVSFAGLSVWKGIEDSIRSMLSRDGKVTVTAATGTVTVTDTPQIVARVEQFIEQQNIGLSRQVVVNVRVLSVDLTNSDSYGISWDAVYNAMSGNFGFAFKNNITMDTNASNLTMKILSTAGSATNSNIKSWAGSNALISALSQQGSVSQVTSASVTTLNNQPAPIQVGKQTSYLASSSTTLSQTGSTTSLQPGLVTTGFSMNLVPHMIDQGRLLLQYAIDISELNKLATVTSGTASIQTPEISTRNFLQRVMLNSGDTLVVSGFEQTLLSANSQGMTDADQPLLGGGVNGSRARSILVMLIQPVIID